MGTNGGRRRQRMSKQMAEQRHAELRFKQRLDGTVTPREIKRRIQRGDSLWAVRESNRLCWHTLRVNGRAEVFLYDRERGQVVTVLPGNHWRAIEARKAFPFNAAA